MQREKKIVLLAAIELTSKFIQAWKHEYELSLDIAVKWEKRGNRFRYIQVETLFFFFRGIPWDMEERIILVVRIHVHYTHMRTNTIWVLCEPHHINMLSVNSFFLHILPMTQEIAPWRTSSQFFSHFFSFHELVPAWILNACPNNAYTNEFHHGLWANILSTHTKSNRTLNFNNRQYDVCLCIIFSWNLSLFSLFRKKFFIYNSMELLVYNGTTRQKSIWRRTFFFLCEIFLCKFFIFQHKFTFRTIK